MEIDNDLFLIKYEEDLNKKFKVTDNSFFQLMNIYNTAMEQVIEKINIINMEYKNIFNVNLVNHISSRIKTPESIVKKMQRKNFEMTYRDLIENINDIAGVRIICPFKSDIYEIINIIRRDDEWKIIKEKDYISSPKKSGYTSYHLIVEIPINYEDNEIYVKVEIQIRSMAMDFWATLEHELQYKSTGKISQNISKELLSYSKIICKIDNKLSKISKRKYDNNIELMK